MPKSKILCSFSGKNGDILWSLPTAKAIAEREGTTVDFAIMTHYSSLVPLIQHQSYINEAYAVDDWLCQHSHYGDQPWQPPSHLSEGYEKVFHLGYRDDPQRNQLPLINFIAWQQGVQLTNPIPFLDTITYERNEPYFAFGFNFGNYEQKINFIHAVEDSTKATFIDVNQLPWLEAASCIKNAVAFIGCRSASNVMAHGVGQQNIFIFEPEQLRLSEVFNCPYGPAENIPPLQNAVGIFNQRAILWKMLWEEKHMPRKPVNLGKRSLISTLHPDDYSEISEGVKVVKETTAFLKSQGARLEIPTEHRYWEYGTLLQILLNKYDGTIPSDISILDVGSGWSALGPVLNFKYNCDMIEYEPVAEYRNDRNTVNGILIGSGRKGLYVHSFSIEAMHPQNYDVVSCVSVLEHVAKHHERQCWKELAYRVRQGGILYLTTDVVEDKTKPYVFDNLRVMPNYTLEDMKERVDMLINECDMEPINGNPNYTWHGNQVHDFTFFRVALRKK